MIENKIFEDAFDDLMKVEGGYANHPDDNGGETKHGISKRSYPECDIKNLTRDEAKEIYYADFWLPNKCDMMPEIVGKKLFDLSVNFGNKQAAKLLQRALRSVLEQVEEDGIVGQKTLYAASKAPCECLVCAMKSEAAGHYRLIVAKNPSFKVFLKGWLRRAYDC